MVAHVREREVKLDVHGTWVMPDLAPLIPTDGRLAAATAELQATYYDGPDAILRRLGITLRRRTGGSDAGWHLKLPAGAARTEVRSSSRGHAVPKALSDLLAGVLGGLPAAPVATIRTVRRSQQILDPDGEMVAEVSDDQVEGQAESQPGQHGQHGEQEAEDEVRRWREVEIELGPAGDEDALDAAVRRLITAGAKVSQAPAKLVRLLGEVSIATPKNPLAALITSYVGDQCRAILLGEIALRDDPADVDAVHDTRVAVRRLRSTLRLFGDFLAVDAGPLDEDLRWFAGLLSDFRDTDVLAENLGEDLRRLPAEEVMGPVQQELQETLGSRRQQALRRWRHSLREPRYEGVLQTVAAWYEEVPLTDAATTASLRDGRRIVKKAQRKADKRLAAAGSDPGQLHRARKAAKRLRYAADLLKPADPKAGNTAKRAKKRQTLLGDHQDEVIAAGFLREQGARLGSTPGHNGFTWGLLLARCQQRAKDLRRRIQRT